MRQGKTDASCSEEIILPANLASQTAHSVDSARPLPSWAQKANELFIGVTTAEAAARIGRRQLCRLRKWHLLMRKGTLAGYTTNRMVRNNRGRRSWEVFGNVNKATFRSDDHPCCLESFDRACPRPATPRPSSYLRESVPDLPTLGLSPRDAGRSQDVEICASPWLHNH
jgi:hypothetical protein